MGLEKYFVFLLGMQSVPLGHFDAARQAGDQEDLWVVPDELMIGDRGGRDGIHDQEGLWCQQAPDCVCWDGREGVCDQEAVWFLASGTVWRPSWAEVCWSIGACAQLLAKGQSLIEVASIFHHTFVLQQVSVSTLLLSIQVYKWYPSGCEGDYV